MVRTDNEGEASCPLVEYSKVLLIYKDELMGIYDNVKLDDVLLGFYIRFEWYTKCGVSKKYPNVKANYQRWADECAAAIKLEDGKKKMIIIDQFINMQHVGGLYGNKLIKDFSIFKKKLKELVNKER